jgi:hypothetical protein
MLTLCMEAEVSSRNRGADKRIPGSKIDQHESAWDSAEGDEERGIRMAEAKA